MSTAVKKKHPLGLLLCNLCTGLNSFYAYGVIGYLFLFLTLPTTQNGLGFSVKEASDIYGTYMMLAFLAPLVGGYLADRFLGLQKTILIGTFVSILFYLSFITILPSDPTGKTLWICFGAGIISGGLGKGNVSALVGELYERNELSRRDEAYSIFYMATNIGSFFGPIIVGFLVETKFATFAADGSVATFGFKYAFLTAFILTCIQFLGFLFLAPRWLKEVGKNPSFKKKEAQHLEKGDKNKFTKIEKNRIIAMAIIFVFVIVFWSAWYQTQSSFTLLTNKLVERKVFGYLVPVAWFVSFNGILCVLFAPLFGKVWIKLDNSKYGDLSVIAKLAFGMILSGIAFFILVIGIRTLNGTLDGTVKMSIFYLLIAYVLLTAGEIMLSPIGMSLFSKLAPAKYSSLVMAVWYLSFSIANKISAKLTGLTAGIGFEKLFFWISVIIVVCGIVLLLLKSLLERLMALDHLKNGN